MQGLPSQISIIAVLFVFVCYQEATSGHSNLITVKLTIAQL